MRARESSKTVPQAPPQAVGRVLRWLEVSAVVAAIAAGAVLGLRRISTPDLGYHLAYGERTLAGEGPVDHSPEVYTLPQTPAEQRVAPPGPGCWYDPQGRYRFANANWLTQVILAGGYRLAGPAGLSVLLSVLVAALLVLCAVAMRRSGVGWVPAAAALLGISLIAYSRYLLRPELLGYVMLAGQLVLLAPLGRGDRRLGWPATAALIALQLLLVNLHSYFLLGLALTGCVVADRLVRWGWQRLRKANASRDPQARAEGVRLAVLLGGQLLVCLANPWTWRLAVLPIETLSFIRRHGIGGGSASTGSHPWSHIGEFFSPFAGHGFAETIATRAYYGMLVLAGLGLLTALWRRRWGWALMMAGMTFVSTSMRRNIAPAAIVVIPVAVAALSDAAAALFAGRALQRRSPGRFLRPLTAGGLVAGALALALLAGTQRFYTLQRHPTRTGLGLSKLRVPIGAAAWLTRYRPQGRLWCDYNISSNLHYFTRPRPDVPILTNTWAYPPTVMRDVLAIARGRLGWRSEFDRLGVQIVALRVTQTTQPLASALTGDADWAVVYVDTWHAIWLRRTGPNAELARASALSESSLDPGDHLRRLAGQDPVPSYAYHLGGTTLSHMGWYTAAIDVLAVALDGNPRRFDGWVTKGICHARRGTIRLARGRDGGANDLAEAEACFRKALELRPGLTDARRNLDRVRRQRADLERGLLWQP